MAQVSFLWTRKFMSICRIFSAYRLDYISRSKDVVLCLFAGFNVYCLFVFIFQFIFLCSGYFPSMYGKYPVLSENTQKNLALNQNTRKFMLVCGKICWTGNWKPHKKYLHIHQKKTLIIYVYMPRYLCFKKIPNFT